MVSVDFVKRARSLMALSALTALCLTTGCGGSSTGSDRSFQSPPAQEVAADTPNETSRWVWSKTVDLYGYAYRFNNSFPIVSYPSPCKWVEVTTDKGNSWRINTQEVDRKGRWFIDRAPYDRTYTIKCNDGFKVSRYVGKPALSENVKMPDIEHR